ncbi:MAG TPA: magnesium-translocating P-type ATPase [Actinomycetota bacterium]|nr:magnesium-translocating P-type ATPase [Actinomycetota bacterium]
MASPAVAALATREDLDLRSSAALDPPAVLARLRTTEGGLDPGEAARRLREIGPNALHTHDASAWRVLWSQLKNPLLPLLAIAAVVSGFTGQPTDSAIIVVIVAISVGLGFANEFRSERAIEELHEQIRHSATVVRGGRPVTVDVTDLVPGDVVLMSLGDVVPADLRLLAVDGFECDEAMLTGESLPAVKRIEAVQQPSSPIDLPSCAFMGTVVKSGTGRAVVVRTGTSTEFGRIATRLGEAPPQTSFQRGLRDFSKLLVRITVVLVVGIFVVNLATGRPLIDAVLFALAIAVGLTPALLPAIVTISLSTGAKRMASKAVLVRRLVAIEDFGNIAILFTDKTGTLTEGQISFREAVGPAGASDDRVFLLGLACSDVVLEAGIPTGGSPLDQALWAAASAEATPIADWTRIDEAAFDYDRRMMSVLVEGPEGRLIVTKGAPENVLAACSNVPDEGRATVDRGFAAGRRIVAVATADGTDLSAVEPEHERDLTLAGFLAFDDPPKADAAASLKRLADLGIAVKVVTGDNERVAQKVCQDLGVLVGRVLTGAQIEAMPDEELASAIHVTTIFARVSPEQKSRIIRLARSHGVDVGYLGDGVNDAVALHDADVGISVDKATDVAKDAADILLLKKDLGTLADGVVEGRRVFANTIKYILMATSSNFGNMFSAAVASAFLKFLPMLPSQILLNNLLYDASQTTIPTDRVDPEVLARPAHWDTRFIRRFMLYFGPISSLFDFATFAVMLWVFHAGESLFQTGWFVESLATQTLVIFVIRTRRVPFFKSRPSTAQLVATLSCAGAGVVIPYLPPIARLLGFEALPVSFLLIVLVFVLTYLTLAELGKARFFRAPAPARPPVAHPEVLVRRHVRKFAPRWSSPRRHRSSPVPVVSRELPPEPPRRMDASS